jgi:hypothetical protein
MYFGLGALLLFVTFLALLLGAARIGYDRGYAAGEAERKRTHVVTRIYKVADLLRTPGDRRALAELLRDNVEPGSWDDSGGSGTIYWLEGPPTELVISQAEAAHEQIAEYLERLRQSLRSGGTTSSASTVARD